MTCFGCHACLQVAVEVGPGREEGGLGRSGGGSFEWHHAPLRLAATVWQLYPLK